MIKKPVAIVVGLLLLLGALFKCDAFSQETPIPEPSLLLPIKNPTLGPTSVDKFAWKLFVSEEGRFSIMAPNPPVKSPTLGPTSVFDIDLGNGDKGVLTYTDSRLGGLWPPELKNLPGKVIYVCGYEGREDVLTDTEENGNIMGISRSFYVEKRFYTVDVYANSPEKAGRFLENARRFVESFQLAEPGKCK